MNKKIIFLSSEDIKKSLTMRDAIEAMKDAFKQLSSGEAQVPLRMGMDIKDTNGGILFMPVYLPQTKKIGLKVVSIFKDNPGKGLPMIQAIVMVMDAEDGKPLAIMDGESLTAIRTGAGSGLATDLLARPDSEVAAIIGAGAQGRTQLEAICTVRPIKRVFIFDIHKQRAIDFANEMQKKLSIPITVENDIKYLSGVDIICTSTSSSEPVFDHKYLKPGVHINGIGSYKPHMCEIPHDTIVNAKVVVDSKESCIAEAGDIIQPIKKGLINKDFIYAELGELLLGLKEKRTSENEITIFKSVGNAVQDLAAASKILENAAKLGLGQEVSL